MELGVTLHFEKPRFLIQVHVYLLAFHSWWPRALKRSRISSAMASSGGSDVLEGRPRGLELLGLAGLGVLAGEPLQQVRAEQVGEVGLGQVGGAVWGGAEAITRSARACRAAARACRPP